MPFKDPTSPEAQASQKAKRQRYQERHRDEIKERKRRQRVQKRQWVKEHPEYRNTYQQRTYYAARQKLYELLGICCIGCGHTDIRVLEFDHILDDGAEDRCRLKGTRAMLDYYVRNPNEARQKLQVLCRNCNWLKRKGYEWRRI